MINITEYLLKFQYGSDYNSWANSSDYVYPSVCIHDDGWVTYNNSSEPRIIPQ